MTVINTNISALTAAALTGAVSISGVTIASVATATVACTPELAPFLSRVRFSRRRTNEAEQVFR